MKFRVQILSLEPEGTGRGLRATLMLVSPLGPGTWPGGGSRRVPRLDLPDSYMFDPGDLVVSVPPTEIEPILRAWLTGEHIEITV